MSKYYRVILNNENDNYYCFVRNGKYFYIRVVVEEINGLYFELITGLEVVYSENGLSWTRDSAYITYELRNEIEPVIGYIKKGETENV